MARVRHLISEISLGESEIEERSMVDGCGLPFIKGLSRLVPNVVAPYV